MRTSGVHGHAVGNPEVSQCALGMLYVILAADAADFCRLQLVSFRWLPSISSLGGATGYARTAWLLANSQASCIIASWIDWPSACKGTGICFQSWGMSKFMAVHVNVR